MGKPTLADVHVSTALTDFSAAAMQNQERFVFPRLAPIKGVPQQANTYHVWTARDFFTTEAKKRAPGTKAARRDFSMSTDTYYCDVYAIAFPVSEQIRANQDPGVNVEEAAAQGILQDLLIRAETDAATALLNTDSVWATDSTPSTTWDDAASTPVSDALTGHLTVSKAIGRRPNTLVVGADVYYKLLEHPDIVDKLPDTQMRIASDADLARIFRVDQFLVMEASYESAQEGVTSSMAFIAGKHGLLCYVDPNPGLMSPTAAVTFSWSGLVGAAPNGIRTKRFMLPEQDALPLIESDHAFDFKAVASAAGYRFKSCVA